MIQMEFKLTEFPGIATVESRDWDSIIYGHSQKSVEAFIQNNYLHLQSLPRHLRHHLHPYTRVRYSPIIVLDRPTHSVSGVLLIWEGDHRRGIEVLNLCTYILLS
jgi:hypothetical protein